jgi:hypothetical protein
MFSDKRNNSFTLSIRIFVTDPIKDIESVVVRHNLFLGFLLDKARKSF